MSFDQLLDFGGADDLYGIHRSRNSTWPLVLRDCQVGYLSAGEYTHNTNASRLSIQIHNSKLGAAGLTAYSISLNHTDIAEREGNVVDDVLLTSTTLVLLKILIPANI